MPLPVQNLSDIYAAQGMPNPQLSYDENGNPIYQSQNSDIGQDYVAAGGKPGIIVTPKATSVQVTPDQIKALADKYGAPSNNAALPQSNPNIDINALADKYAPSDKYGNPIIYQAPSDQAQQPGVIQNLGTGIKQGVEDVANTIGTGIGYLDKAVSKVTGGAGSDRQQAFEKYVATQNKAFEQQSGNSTAASIGRIGGQALASAPFVPAKALQGVSLVAEMLPTIAQPLLRAVGMGAVGGGIFGAATSSTVPPEQRPGYVAGQTLSGAVAGPVVAGAGAALSKAIPAAKSMWASFGPIQQLANTSGAPASAITNVISILENAGFTPQTAQAALITIGSQATLADLDPSITAELSGLASLRWQSRQLLLKEECQLEGIQLIATLQI